jgi:glucose/mannose-6-phosphate isomerase
MSMLDDVRAQPHQIGDALWRVEAADVPARDLPGGLVVCGMGGSAVGGDLAAAALRGRQARPLRTVRGYELEPWVDEHTLVLCCSYSGTTEETLACFEAAGAAGAPRVALTTGGELAERARAEGVPVIGVPSGMQPRAAVVYMTVAVLECAAACGAAPSVRAELEAAVGLLEALLEDEEPMRVAEALRGTLPVVYGAGVSAVPAVRLKNQLNENAKVAAFAGELPEICHNEIEGWAWGSDAAPLAAVMLTAPGLHPRLVRRLEVLRELIEAEGVPVTQLEARGEDPVAHVLSLVLLGDLVSVHLADLLGVDAGAIPAITAFKQRLG